MNLQSTISKSIGEDVQQQIANKTNTSPDKVNSIITSSLPILLGTLGKNASRDKGAAELSQTLDEKHDGSLLSNIGDLFTKSGDTNSEGDKILGHIFDSKSDATEKIAKKNGVDISTVIKVLSFIAPIVLAQLGKKKIESKLDKGGLTDLLKQQKTANGNPLMDIATKFFDKDGDGQVVDDLFNMFSKGAK